GLVSWWTEQNLGSSAEQLAEMSQHKERIADLQLAFANVVMPGNDYLITGNPEEKTNFNARNQTVQDQIAELKGIFKNGKEAQLIAMVADDYVKVARLEASILSLTNPRGNPVGAKTMEEMDLAADNLSANLEELHSLISASEAATKANVATSIRNSLIIIFLAVLIAITFALIVARLLGATVVKPLIELVEVADTIARGDLTRSVEIQVKGDVGRLVDSFNNMIGELRKIISHLTTSTNEIASTSHQLSSVSKVTVSRVANVDLASQEVAREAAEQTEYVSNALGTVKEVNMAIMQVAAGAQEQAEHTSKTAARIGQMSTTVQEVAKSARNVTGSAETTRAAASKGELAVDSTISGMQDIKANVFETAGKIKELGEHSQQIGQIVQVIDDIAAQTNLLSLNAAIEAARAGEHGKGFAVVADEVRKLAERSSQATGEISELITRVQGLTEGAVAAMGQGTAQVEQGEQLALEAGTALKDIMEAVKDTYTQIQNISASASAMSESAETVVQAIDIVSSITEQNTAATEQVTAASNQVAHDMENMARFTEKAHSSSQQVQAATGQMTVDIAQISSAAENLTQLATGLKQLVAGFVV
ncbi:MAG TPA: methyl-accepting chemotaxis protein, partial [Bacillota bacterium]|nr:methyl-accepting chemotaxis protein [Bacillota bacterium]